MLNTMYEGPERPAAVDPARMASHRDICLYFACRDFDSAYNELRQKGAKVNPPKVAGYGMKQLYVTDPDGYLLCFQWQVRDSRPIAANQAQREDPSAKDTSMEN